MSSSPIQSINANELGRFRTLARLELYKLNILVDNLIVNFSPYANKSMALPNFHLGNRQTEEDKQMRLILFIAKVRTKVEVVQCRERVRELAGWLNSDLDQRKLNEVWDKIDGLRAAAGEPGEDTTTNENTSEEEYRESNGDENDTSDLMEMDMD